MPDLSYGNHVYLMENEEVPKVHHKIFILNQEQCFYIASPLELWEEKWLPFAKISCKNSLNRGSTIISNLFPSYQKLMYATNMVIKRNNCLLKNRMRIIF